MVHISVAPLLRYGQAKTQLTNEKKKLRLNGVEIISKFHSLRLNRFDGGGV